MAQSRKTATDDDSVWRAYPLVKHASAYIIAFQANAAIARSRAKYSNPLLVSLVNKSGGMAYLICCIELMTFTSKGVLKYQHPTYQSNGMNGGSASSEYARLEERSQSTAGMI